MADTSTTDSGGKVWLEYAGPSGCFIADDLVLPIGVPVQADGKEADRLIATHTTHRFIVRADGPAADETSEANAIAPSQPALPGPIPAPTSPEGGQDGGFPNAH